MPPSWAMHSVPPTDTPADRRPRKQPAKKTASTRARVHKAQAATPVVGLRDGQRHSQVIVMPGVALHPLPDLARKGDLHAARKNLESIKSHKRCLQHRPTSVNTKTDTDRPKAIDVRPRIHDLRWQASLHSMRASLAARHPQELGTTSKGYTFTHSQTS